MTSEQASLCPARIMSYMNTERQALCSGCLSHITVLGSLGPAHHTLPPKASLNFSTPHMGIVYFSSVIALSVVLILFLLCHRAITPD